MDRAWDNSRTNILSLVAWGGVGKTALVNVWLNQMMQSQYHGTEQIYGYSFYSQDAAEGHQTSADLFIATASAWFGGPDPDKGSPWDKGECLAELIKRQRTLLILDGLESLQYPPGAMEGRLKDPGLQCLMRELGRHNPGLCIVTTRLPVDDLKDFAGSSVEKIELENLSLEASAAYLKHLGVQGSNNDLTRTVNEFDRHALALTLLGSYLRIVYKGDVRQRDKIVRLTDEKKQGNHVRRMMESYEQWFVGKPALQILFMIGLFDRPAEPGAVAALRSAPVIKDLTDLLQDLSEPDWQYALDSLKQARLLNSNNFRADQILDCHPLIREHFAERAKSKDKNTWKEANKRLYEYYTSQTKEYPNSIEEMNILCATIYHCCQAGNHKESLDELFIRRMNRSASFLIHKLGAPGTALVALSNFFDQRWRKLSNILPASSHTYLMWTTGVCLRAVGRLHEATELFLSSFQISKVRQDLESAAVDASSLSDLHVALGELTQALQYAEIGMKVAQRQESEVVKYLAAMHLAYVLHQQGKLREAEVTFGKMEIEKNEVPSLRGYRYCDLLLDQGRMPEVFDLLLAAKRSVKQTLNARPPLDKALFYLLRGSSLLVSHRKKLSLSDIMSSLNSALEYFRQAGQQEFIALGLLIRTQLYGRFGRYDEAFSDLNFSFSISTSGGIRLYQADCHLEFARLHLAIGEKDKAHESWLRAKEMIEEIGYHRRDPEIHLIEAQLHLIFGEKDKARESLAKAKELIDQMGMHRWDVDVRELEKLISE